MFKKIVIFCIIFFLLTTNFSASKQNSDFIVHNEQITYIGEVEIHPQELGFKVHRFFLHNQDAFWSVENGKVHGVVQLNYSVADSFKDCFSYPAVIGFSVFLDGEKVGGDRTFNIFKDEDCRGELLADVFFDFTGERHVSLIVHTWCFRFLEQPTVRNDADPYNRFTFRMFNARQVIIDVDIDASEDMVEVVADDSLWLYARHDIRNTACSSAVGKGDISTYRMRKIGCKYLIGMGSGEPKVVDIDGDGELEILFGTQTGYMYAVEKGWKVDWKCDIEASATYIAPEIGDVDGDGDYEVVIASDNMLEAETAGVRVVDKYGNIMAVWHNPEGGFPFGDKRLVDLNGDGKDEILVCLLGDDERGNKLYALSYEAEGVLEELWHFPAHFWVKYPPAVADINNDGELEIVFTSHDMCVYCLDIQGNLLWNYTTKGGIQYAHPGGLKRVTGHAMVSDIDNDGFLEVIITAGVEDHPNWSAVYCLDGNGEELWRFNPGESIRDSSAVGDIDNNGKAEIVFGDMKGTVYVITHDGKLLWKYCLPKYYFGTLIPYYNGVPKAIFYPSLADLDGDGFLEIIMVAAGFGYFIFSHDGQLLNQWVNPLGELSFLGASIADIDQDGDLEILVGKSFGKPGLIGKLGIIDQL